MKITAITTHLMQAGSMMSTAAQPTGSRAWLFLRVHTDAGIHGVGECSGWPRVVETAVRDLSNLLIGEDPRDTSRLWNKCQVALMAHGVTGTVGGGALAGIDMALWDIKAKALGVPVWALLGGKLRDAVRIYGHARNAERALALVAQGITAIKFSGVVGVVAKATRIRAAVGTQVDLMADLHGAPWHVASDAVAVARALEPFHLLFLEDAVPPEDIDGQALVRTKTSLPLAAGERFAFLSQWREWINRRLIDVVQPDTGRAGGITQMMKLAALAEANGVTMAPHSGSLGPVAEFAAMHVMAAINNALILERVVDDWPVREQVITQHLELRAGHLVVPERPGLGVDFDDAVVARFPCTVNASIPANATDSYAPGTELEYTYVQPRQLRAAAFSDPGDGA